MGKTITFENSLGICPICGYNEGLDFEEPEHNRNSVEKELYGTDGAVYPFTCPNCHSKGKEYYSLEYAYTQITPDEELIEEPQSGGCDTPMKEE